MSHGPSPRRRRLLLATALLLTLATLSPATEPAATLAPSIEAKPSKSIAEPVSWRVFQRNGQDQADIPVVLAKGVDPESIISVSLTPHTSSSPVGTYRDGKIAGVPTGGPYMITVKTKKIEKRTEKEVIYHHEQSQVGPIFVGDLWVLAGQSNMEGLGNLADVTPPHDRVALLGMDGRWTRAEEPLHWRVDSLDPVHSGDPATRAARSEAEHRKRVKGAGLGLPFGVVMATTTNVPVGLLACAHGGTSMKQWDPARKDEGGKSLYGSMVRQVGLAGGKVKGVLWYQGESDRDAADVYPKVFTDLIAAVRCDLGDPDLPFYLIQIARHVTPNEGNPKGWNAIQDAQRQIPDRVPNTAVVAAVDLELDDGIHIGTEGHKRLGYRLARIAQRELFDQAGATTPTLERVSRRADNSLLLKFKGVNRTPVPNPAEAGTTIYLFGNAPPAAPTVPVLRAPKRVTPGGEHFEGLRPARHIAGFSIRKDDGTEVSMIYDAAVGQSPDTVVLKLAGKTIPEGVNLWYGYGLDPYCNLADGLDMAVPVFGPIPLDGVK